MSFAAPLSSLLDISIQVVTFNCGRTLIDIDAFAATLFRPYTSRDIQKRPDILVFALEELAPIAYSFLGGTFLAPYFSRFIRAVQVASGPSVKYKHLATHNAGMTGILVLIKADISPRIEWLKTADVGVGKWRMGNKGAAGVSFGYITDDDNDPTPLTFVAAHLAAMEDQFERRNRDWENIVRGLAFGPKKHSPRSIDRDNDHDEESESEPLIAKADLTRQSMFSPGALVFFAGDLNYRTSNNGPEPEEHINFPQPKNNRDDPKHYSHLFKNDQLSREMKAGRTLQLLAESKVDFPPTYKFSAEQQAHASSLYMDEGESPTWYWSNHRWPSWTDRILFSAPLAASDKALKIIEYGPLAIQPTSDHRPVSLALQLDASLAKSLTQDYAPPFPLNAQWAEQRATARRLEVAVGILYYLSLTWEGNSIIVATIVGTAGGWLIMQSLVGT